ncbi:prenyltransferase/squalene oxidase repeat-containing protein [Sphaerisporangium aureirubrum]
MGVADVAARAREVVRGLLARPCGEVSPSVYETGRLVALAPWLTGHCERVAYLTETQGPDGTWGPHERYALVPTLSATDALLAELGCPRRAPSLADSSRPAGARAEVVAGTVRRALRALWRLGDKPERLGGPALPDTPAIELIVPALVASINRRLRELGPPGVAPLPLPDGVDGARLAAVRVRLASGKPVPQKLLHALEVAGDAATRAPGVHPTPSGVIGASPAATAAWLGTPTPTPPVTRRTTAPNSPPHVPPTRRRTEEPSEADAGPSGADAGLGAGDASTPDTPTELGVKDASTPDAPTGHGAEDASTPNTPTGHGAGDASTPNTPTGHGAGDASTPNTPTEPGTGDATTPNTPTEPGTGDATTPNTPTEPGTKDASTPDTPTELGAEDAGVPGTDMGLGVKGAEGAVVGYLEEVVRVYGGVVPCGTPITVFERGWALSWMVRAGVPVHVPGELAESLVGAAGVGGVPAGAGLPADADTTSVALYALALLGVGRAPESLWDYHVGPYFCTWRGEDGVSTTVNAHVLDAFGQYVAAHPAARGRYGAAMAAVAEWLGERQDAEGCWTDRWHASPYYATACCALALGAFGGGSAVAAVRRAVRWVLETQRADGSWGVWRGTAEETAYAMHLLLMDGRSSVTGESLAAAARGYAYLMRVEREIGLKSSGREGWEVFPPMWHDKDLYLPRSIVRAVVTAALHLAQREPAITAWYQAGARNGHTAAHPGRTDAATGGINSTSLQKSQEPVVSRFPTC